MRYLVDLDGVLCEQREDMQYQHASPYWDMIEKVNWLHGAGHEITIWSGRGSGTGEDWEEATRRQLEDWGVEYDRLSVGEKPVYDVLVDDRAIRPEELG